MAELKKEAKQNGNRRQRQYKDRHNLEKEINSGEKTKHIGAYTTDKLGLTRVYAGYEPETRPDSPKTRDIDGHVKRTNTIPARVTVGKWVQSNSRDRRIMGLTARKPRDLAEDIRILRAEADAFIESKVMEMKESSSGAANPIRSLRHDAYQARRVPVRVVIRLLEKK